MSILIGDIGSTSGDWAVISQGDQNLFVSPGFNPTAHEREEADGLLQAISEKCIWGDLTEIHYYGAGVNSPKSHNVIHDCFSLLAPKTCQLYIGSDILGAARAVCQYESGTVAILGTGSNACYYADGQIQKRAVNLGYLLGDEGSGFAIGKALLRSFCYNQLPPDLTESITGSIPEPGQLVDDLYRDPTPNRYIASFARIAIENRDDAHIKKLVSSVFQSFIHSHFPIYKNSQKIHFVGSIAFYFCAVLEAELLKAGLKMGRVVRRPIEELVKYHQKSK